MDVPNVNTTVAKKALFFTCFIRWILLQPGSVYSTQASLDALSKDLPDFLQCKFVLGQF